MATTTETEKRTFLSQYEEVFRLPTRNSQAVFVRKQLRHHGLNVNELADISSLAWITVARFADLGGNYPMTRFPRHDTVKAILNAFGVDLLYGSKKNRAVAEV